MRKTFLLSLVMCITLLTACNITPTTPNNEIIQDGDYSYYFVSQQDGLANPGSGAILVDESQDIPKPYRDGYIIVGYTGVGGDLTLPQNASDGTPVIGVGRSAFAQKENIRSVDIPEGYQYIFESAFAGAQNLTSIHISASVEYIASGIIFEHCDNLEEIQISEGNSIYFSANNCIIQKEGMALIAGCRGSVIPQGTLSVKCGAFSERTGPREIHIPSSVTEIQSMSFIKCESTKVFCIEGQPLAIGQHAFSDCASATIYCQANEPLENWDSLWRGNDLTGLTPVVWAYSCFACEE